MPPPPAAGRHANCCPDETVAAAGHRQRARACCWNCASGARNSTRARPRWPRANRCWPPPEQKLSARVAELQALQKKLEALDAARKEREDASWQGLVKLYEAMKPRDAATIFNDLEMPVLLQVVDRMKEAKAAPVLAAMQPDKARDVTAKLAQMRTQRDTPGRQLIAPGERTGRRTERRCRSTSP